LMAKDTDTGLNPILRSIGGIDARGPLCPGLKSLLEGSQTAEREADMSEPTQRVIESKRHPPTTSPSRARAVVRCARLSRIRDHGASDLTRSQRRASTPSRQKCALRQERSAEAIDSIHDLSLVGDLVGLLAAVETRRHYRGHEGGAIVVARQRACDRLSLAPSSRSATSGPSASGGTTA